MGVGPGSPSRDAANWLPSRFSLSVETRRRYGWLRIMVFPGARLFRAPIWSPSGVTTVIFLLVRATRSGERARFVGLSQGCTGLWTAGCWLARRLHQLKASTTIMDLGISFFLISVQCVALRNLDLLIKTGWSVIYLFFAENAGRGFRVD